MESHSSKTQENLATGSHRGFSGLCESTEWKTGERINKRSAGEAGKLSLGTGGGSFCPAEIKKRTLADFAGVL